MSTLTKGTITSNTTQTGYNSVWASLYDTDMQVPQIWGEIVKKYGPGIGLLEFLYMTGSIVPIAGPNKKLFEEGSFIKTVETIGASGAVAAGARDESEGPRPAIPFLPARGVGQAPQQPKL